MYWIKRWYGYAIHLCTKSLPYSCLILFASQRCLSSSSFVCRCLFLFCNTLVSLNHFLYLWRCSFWTRTCILYRDDNFARATLKQIAIISRNICCSFFCFSVVFFSFYPKIINGCHFFFCLPDICFCHTKINRVANGNLSFMCGCERVSKHRISYTYDTLYTRTVEYVGYKCT